MMPRYRHTPGDYGEDHDRSSPLNKYTFEVDVRANKSQIRDAIESCLTSR